MAPQARFIRSNMGQFLTRRLPFAAERVSHVDHGRSRRRSTRLLARSSAGSGKRASDGDDPMLVPKKALQVVVPRPGVSADVQIGLVGGGDIEGALMKSGELGFEGVDLELVDGSGKVAGTARTDFDGFFLFERVAYGSYRLRVSASSAAVAKIAQDLGLTVNVTPEHSIARIGSIQPRPMTHVAAAGLGRDAGSSLK